MVRFCFGSINYKGRLVEIEKSETNTKTLENILGKVNLDSILTNLPSFETIFLVLNFLDVILHRKFKLYIRVFYHNISFIKLRAATAYCMLFSTSFLVNIRSGLLL